MFIGNRTISGLKLWFLFWEVGSFSSHRTSLTRKIHCTWKCYTSHYFTYDKCNATSTFVILSFRTSHNLTIIVMLLDHKSLITKLFILLVRIVVIHNNNKNSSSNYRVYIWLPKGHLKGVHDYWNFYNFYTVHSYFYYF